MGVSTKHLCSYEFMNVQLHDIYMFEKKESFKTFKLVDNMLKYVHSYFERAQRPTFKTCFKRYVVCGVDYLNSIWTNVGQISPHSPLSLCARVCDRYLQLNFCLAEFLTI